jgi:hypothetical protein
VKTTTSPATTPSAVITPSSKDTLSKITDNPVHIGYTNADGKKCYLKMSNKNAVNGPQAIFDCSSVPPALSVIQQKQPNVYKIFSGRYSLYWNGRTGNKKDAEFRLTDGPKKWPGDDFTINRHGEMFSIVGSITGGKCPLIKRKDASLNRIIFHCRQAIEDNVYWITVKTTTSPATTPSAVITPSSKACNKGCTKDYHYCD